MPRQHSTFLFLVSGSAGHNSNPDARAVVRHIRAARVVPSLSCSQHLPLIPLAVSLMASIQTTFDPDNSPTPSSALFLLHARTLPIITNTTASSDPEHFRLQVRQIQPSTLKSLPLNALYLRQNLSVALPPPTRSCRPSAHTGLFTHPWAIHSMLHLQKPRISVHRHCRSLPSLSSLLLSACLLAVYCFVFTQTRSVRAPQLSTGPHHHPPYFSGAPTPTGTTSLRN